VDDICDAGDPRGLRIGSGRLCRKITGGGSIDSITGAPEKATFGFGLNVTPDENGNPTAVKGQFQFNDHSAGVNFHLDRLQPASFALIYPDLSNPMALMFAYEGTYSCNAGTGDLVLGVESDKQVEPFSGTLIMTACSSV
jgi:hypothetical protein